MKKKTNIVFYIIFPIISLLIGLFLFFYLDMMNGPIIIIIIESLIYVTFIIFRILLRKQKFLLRMVPTISFILVSILTLSFAHPYEKDIKALSTYSKVRPVVTFNCCKAEG